MSFFQAAIVLAGTSTAIGLFFWAVIIGLHHKIALIFSSSSVVLEAVDKLTPLLAFAIPLNSIQPILSGKLVPLFLDFIFLDKMTCK